MCFGWRNGFGERKDCLKFSFFILFANNHNIFVALFVYLHRFLKITIGMQGNKIIDYSDKSLFEDGQYIPSPDEKDFYTPEEAYELVMSDVRSVYFMKDAV